jgi:two-component sensor histidine kinase
VGIIVNELVTNALKYAFSDARGGTVTVTVRREGEGVLLIRVADDGPGFPAEVLESGSYGFGLTLVEGYAQQFRGSMDVASAGGAAVSVRLQLE